MTNRQWNQLCDVSDAGFIAMAQSFGFTAESRPYGFRLVANGSPFNAGFALPTTHADGSVEWYRTMSGAVA
jgi:hypothetical protein